MKIIRIRPLGRLAPAAAAAGQFWTMIVPSLASTCGPGPDCWAPANQPAATTATAAARTSARPFARHATVLTAPSLLSCPKATRLTSFPAPLDLWCQAGWAVRPTGRLLHDGRVTEEDVIRFVAGLPGVEVVTAGEENGAPEVAWGDSFFFYDPDGDTPADRRFPFATIVTKNYPDFDTASDLDRPGVFRVNVVVGRQAYRDLFGHQPAEHADHQASYDYSALDRVIPHPVYARQAWVSVLNPGEASTEQLRSMLAEAHARAASRHRPSR
jgi:hypothetical protein